MNKKYKILLIAILLIIFVTVVIFYFNHNTVAVLQPRGPIALKERNLLLTAVGLMLVVVIPVFVLTFLIVYKYREGRGAKYRPDFDHSRALEAVWWLIPSVLILTLSIIIWNSSHNLDPYRPIASNNPTLNIEVVAMDWKWLFIYPKQQVASVNQVNIPINTPVKFYITSDSVMNSFWIPQLGGQIYAMPGMDSQINLMATFDGNFYGSSANISGSGFASMHFMAHAISPVAFNSWVVQTQSSKQVLNQGSYSLLNQPSINNPVTYYSVNDAGLFASIINKYMAPGDQMSAMAGMQ